MRRRAWAALGRRPGIVRLIQLAAAGGVAVFSATEDTETVEAMRSLLDACIEVEMGWPAQPVNRKQRRGR